MPDETLTIEVVRFTTEVVRFVGAPETVGMISEMKKPNAVPYVWAAALIAVVIWGVSGTPQMAHTSASSTHLARAR
ncbi:hypothetical protein ACVIGA_003784 [Bradyrhizobium sp. USDA 3240]